jgi:hypothetical protein
VLVLQEISSIRLIGSQVTEAGILQVAAMPRLRQLDVRNTKDTRMGMEAMRRLRPDVALVE